MPNPPIHIDSAQVPARFACLDIQRVGTVEQLLEPGRTVAGTYEVLGVGANRHGTLTLADGGTLQVVGDEQAAAADPCLLAPKSHLSRPDRLFGSTRKLTWRPAPADQPITAADEIRRSNADLFRFLQEDPTAGRLGLRTPQIGALHAVLGHWSVSHQPVTVVMPTGTGKTETMLALLAHGTVQRLLVVVPSNALRAQTHKKLLTWGLLPTLGVLGEGFLYPIVGRLEHELRSVEEAEALLEPCNVIITTIHALAGSDPAALERVAQMCSHLFLDEAHHVPAPTWRAVKAGFIGKPIVQFTATPYRRDGKRVEGRIIYNYPLRKAQNEGYFSRIGYLPVFEFSQEAADRRIAEAALGQLRADLVEGLDHLIMARVDTINRAEKVLELYSELAAEFDPLIIHSQLGRTKQRLAMEGIQTRASRIVVCVDMLGEGFDLPQLKIAAIHDAHKSLAITLQFTGRFTRSAGDHLGAATIVANSGDVSMERALRQLYAEDADWNRIIEELGDEAIGNRVQQSEFLATFPDALEGVPLESVLPKMSTVIYRTTCSDWTPDGLAESVRSDTLYGEPVWSDTEKVALFVTRELEDITWGTIRELQNLVWDLYLIFWDADSNLLYIHSSNNDELHQDLATAVSDATALRIHGEDVYRALSGIKRLVLMNLGLLHAAGRAIRHTMHNGSDVGEQLKPGQLAGKSKTNLFGRGYENGERASIGCSLKGRIWSYQVAESIPEWVTWCKALGAKVTNAAITDEQVLKGVLRPEVVTGRPALVPLAIDWNHRTYMRGETALNIRTGEQQAPFFDTELQILEHGAEGDIRFVVVTSTGQVEYRASFSGDGIAFASNGQEAHAVTGRGHTTPLSEFFKKEPPTILFERDTFIEDNLLFVAHPEQIGPYDRAQIIAWPWTNVDLAKESQRVEKRADSIQRYVLDQICADNAWELVFDDDSSGESGDIVAVRRDGAHLHIDLYHCKYAKDGSVGVRVQDLFQVCGQAQKSIRWRENTERLFDHLRLREARRIDAGKPSRIEKGNPRVLFELLNNAHLLKPVFRIFIVQPGLSKASASADQLRLLGSTELYLSDTFSIPLGVVGSP